MNDDLPPRARALRARAVELAEANGWTELLVQWRINRGKAQGADMRRDQVEAVTRQSLRKCPTWVIEALTDIFSERRV